MNKKHVLLFLFSIFLVPVLIIPSLVLGHVVDEPHEEDQNQTTNAGIPAFVEDFQQQNLETASTLTLLAAFLGGALMLFAPCSASLIPAFFAVSFKEKKKLTLMTIIFFLGFALVFSLLGVGASFIGTWLIINQAPLTLLVGGLLILFGLVSFFGIKLPGFIPQKSFGTNAAGVFGFGMAFALGYAVCSGPILLAILTLAATLPTSTAILFMLVYSLGMAIPLLILAYFFERFDVMNNKWVVGKILEVEIMGKNFSVHTTNLISGILFISIGILFVFFGSTAPVIPKSTGITASIYETIYGLQDKLITMNLPYSDVILVLLFIGIIGFVTRDFWYKKGTSNNVKK